MMEEKVDLLYNLNWSFKKRKYVSPTGIVLSPTVTHLDNVVRDRFRLHSDQMRRYSENAGFLIHVTEADPVFSPSCSSCTEKSLNQLNFELKKRFILFRCVCKNS